MAVYSFAEPRTIIRQFPLSANVLWQIFVCCAAAGKLGPRNSFFDLDQGDRIGVLPCEGMNSTDDKQRKEEPPPPCSPEFMRTPEA
jgi:hypothetical protein